MRQEKEKHKIRQQRKKHDKRRQRQEDNIILVTRQDKTEQNKTRHETICHTGRIQYFQKGGEQAGKVFRGPWGMLPQKFEKI